MSAQSHRSDPKILGRRTLEKDHRALAALLRPGMSVLDIGCGTGAITSGIARAVGPSGRVVGVDRDEGLLELARQERSGVPNLRFESGDATDLRYAAEFDIVTAARVLQWIATPEHAVESMKRAAKPDGLIVVLDYSHEYNCWDPEPPLEFRNFYKTFLRWRNANQWENEIAHRLPDLFEDAGLIDITSQVEDEITVRGDADFEEQTALWSGVIEHAGGSVANAGFCTHAQGMAAHRAYVPWVKTTLRKQTLVLRAVTARVP